MNTQAIQWSQKLIASGTNGDQYSVKDVNTVVNTGTPRAIDGSHGF